MTQKLNKINNDVIKRVRGPNSNFAIHGLEAPSKNKNKHSNPDKMGRLQLSLFTHC